MTDYMTQVYQITDQDTNILDILNMMVASDVETSVAGNAVRQNVLACTNEPTTKQKEIEASKKEIDGPTMFISNGNQFQLLSPNMSVLLPFAAPDSRTMHVAEFVKDRIIFCGGKVEPDGGYLDTCYQLSPVCSGWTQPLKQARSYATSASMGKYMLVLAGENETGLIDSIERLNLSPGTWTLTQWNTPTVLAASCTVSISPTEVLFLGGNPTPRKVQLLDVTDGSWTSLPDAPSDIERSGCTTGTYQGQKGVFVSGYPDAAAWPKSLTKSTFFELTSQQWKTLPDHNAVVGRGLYNPGGDWGENPLTAERGTGGVEQFDGTNWINLGVSLQLAVPYNTAITTVPAWFSHWLLGVEQVDWAVENTCHTNGENSQYAFMMNPIHF